tara:strand:- start:1192 stop:2226 length:1035 start_codon:yes stop_codon:yes gene_type:complete
MSEALPYIETGLNLLGASQAFRGDQGGQQVTQAALDPQTQARQADIYQRAVGLADQPFIPYTGPMVAGFTPDQLAAFEGQRGLFEQAGRFDPGAFRQSLLEQQAPQFADPRRIQARSLLDVDLGAYQSPYQQQVIDLAMQDIQRQEDIARGGAQERAIRAGAFGGSRSAILEGEATRPYIEQKARTAADLRQRGFEQAARMAEADILRDIRAQEFDISGEAEAARQRAAAGLAQQQFQAGLLGGQERAQQQALSGLLGIGGLQQALQQQALGAARSEFDRALQYPYQQFGLLSQAVSGMPSGKTITESERLGMQDRLLSGIGGLQRAIGSIGSLLPEDNYGQMM